jgi:hypothetical protein
MFVAGSCTPRTECAGQHLQGSADLTSAINLCAHLIARSSGEELRTTLQAACASHKFLIANLLRLGSVRPKHAMKTQRQKKVVNLTLRSHIRHDQMIFHHQQTARQQQVFFHAVIQAEKFLPLRTAQSLSSQRITKALSARYACKAISIVTSLETRRRCGSCDIFTECAVAHGNKCGSWDGSLLKTSTTVATCLNELVIFI